MIKTLELNGRLIERTPGQARSIRLLVLPGASAGVTAG
jgi:hypothetical protein